MTDVLERRLRVDLRAGEACGICRKDPILYLALHLYDHADAEIVEVRVCRDCLAEYAPELLSAVESGDAP